METYIMDKSFYDIGPADELKELWEQDDLDPTMHEAIPPEWCLGLAGRGAGVVLRDRLMTDAALGGGITISTASAASRGRPVAADHSYSLASDGDSTRGSPPPPASPHSHHGRVDDMESECFPAISIRTACGRPALRRLDDDPDLDPRECVRVKDEPLSEDTESVHSSYPPSPLSVHIKSEDRDEHVDVKMESPTPTAATIVHTLNGSIFLTAPHSVMPRLKTLPAAFHRLPPTPPSCSSSDDSEGDASGVGSGVTPRKVTKRDSGGGGRQPIHTPLISSQPKGSTGMLILTEEEKRTLIAEGYPVPTRLPLTKAEEKSLKKIRRKIKNKISAQESRRKKKEYMDQLEKKVEHLVSENTDFKKKIETLESSNSNLLGELQKLRAIVAKTYPQVARQLNIK